MKIGTGYKAKILPHTHTHHPSIHLLLSSENTKEVRRCRPIQAGSTLLVVWIDRNAGGCEAPADEMPGGSTDTGWFVW